MVLYPNHLGYLLEFLHIPPQASGVLLPPKAYTQDYLLLVQLGCRKQKCSNPHLHLTSSLSQPMIGRKVWKPIFTTQVKRTLRYGFDSTLLLQELANSSQRWVPGLVSIWHPLIPLASFFWEPFPINHLHRQSLSQPISERQIYGLYYFGP